MIKILSYTLKIFLFMYPLFPWLKEWHETLFNIVEILMILIIFISSIICTITIKEIRIKITKILFNLFILLSIILIYSLISQDNVYNIISGFRIYFLYITLYYSMVIIVICRDNRSVYSVLKPLIYVSILLSVLGAIQIFSPNIVKGLHSANIHYELSFKTNFMPLSMYNRVISLMLDPNVYGVYLVLVYIIFLDYKDKNLIIGKKLITINCFFIFNIIFTNSRQALILFIILWLIKIMLYLLKSSIITKKVFTLFTTFFLIVGTITIKYINFLKKYLRIDTLINLNGRVDKNIFLSNVFKNDVLRFMFGNGIDSGRTVIYENSYFLVIAQFGLIISIIISICIIYSVCLVSNKYLNKNINRNIIVILFLIACIAGDYLIIPQIGVVVICGMFLNNGKNEKDNKY